MTIDSTTYGITGRRVPLLVLTIPRGVWTIGIRIAPSTGVVVGRSA